MNIVKIYGFSLLRNGIKFDYPFMECLAALTSLCDHSVLALGDSEDKTEEHVRRIEKLECIPTVWDMNSLGDGGQILSQQTNVALSHLREIKRNEEYSWGFYLQTDELIHEDHFDQIRKDIQLANDGDYDAVRFRYYHFWLNHNEIAISKRWYPQEVRAIKLHSDIKSHGDAQGFSGHEKIFESDVPIFHYGHVREKDKREAKQDLLIKMIRPADKFNKYKAREKKAFNQTLTLPYFGSHPKWMKERIEKFGDTFSGAEIDRVVLHDPDAKLSQTFLDSIKATEVTVSSKKVKEALTLETSFVSRLFSQQIIPDSMMSPFAREWTYEMRMAFLLWTNQISTK